MEIEGKHGPSPDSGEKITEDEKNQETAAKERLNACRTNIKGKKPKIAEVGNSVAGCLVASDQTDWKRIRYYKGNMNEVIREKFGSLKRDEGQLELQAEGSEKTYGPPYDNTLGLYWHKLLSSRLAKKKIEEKADEKLADELFKTIKEKFDIKLFECDFPLYGYVYNKEKAAPEVYLWQDAEADAIGWYYDKEKKCDKYVIVDWKVVDLLGFWKKSTTYGWYLHQSLVYARLLQLHMELDYLPPILLVPISNNDGRTIHPGLFYDYPDECKEAINVHCWSTTLPEPPRKIQRQWPFNADKLEAGLVDPEMLLTEFFADGAKVKDLLKAFEWNSLQAVEPEDHEMIIEEEK